MVNFLQKGKTKRLILLVIVVIAIGWFFYYYTVNTPASTDSTIKQFIVEPGWGNSKISQELKKQGLIRNVLIFRFYTWQEGINSRLQDGEYFLASNLNIKEIAQILSRGAGVTREITLTFIEGWNNREIADYLAQKGIAQPRDFFTIIQKKAEWWDNYDFLASRPKSTDLEGYLFPDTYRVFRKASLQDIIQKMLDNFGNKLTDEIKAEIEKQGRTIHEILTLASILEKEVSTDKDRKMAADIFYKRLEAGMALQADSTINYLTGKGVTRASIKDLKIDSPYNTYKYRGLPPGPISNPGMSAILAAIYPSSNSYWYFLTTPDGKVIYSETHDEHVAAKARYYR